MTAVRIVGVGSPQGADCAGWVAVEALRHSGLPAQFPAGLLSLHQCKLPACLPQLLVGSRCAIVIDAVAGKTARVLRLDAAQLQNRSDLASVHGVGVGEMLALIATLQVPPPAVTVLAIEIDPDAAPGAADQLVMPLVPDLSRCVGQCIVEFLAAPGLLLHPSH
jgi:Ni,Fe-hydrogenase maturation factor